MIIKHLPDDFCLLIRSANFSYGFLRKSGHAHYSMFFLLTKSSHYALEAVENVVLTVTVYLTSCTF